MRKIIYCIIGLATLAMTTSCDKDVISAFDKLEYFSYLQNKTDQDVMVSFYRYLGERTYNVKAGGETEIPATEVWGMKSHQHIAPEDSVVFQFADGTRIVHRCMVTYLGDTARVTTFLPTENNIFCVDEEGLPSSWKESKIKPMKVRQDYEIRK